VKGHNLPLSELLVNKYAFFRLPRRNFFPNIHLPEELPPLSLTTTEYLLEHWPLQSMYDDVLFIIIIPYYYSYLLSQLQMHDFIRYFDSKCPNALLCQAVKDGKFELVRKLVQDGYDISEKDQALPPPKRLALC
jgi:hypothetical protein